MPQSLQLDDTYRFPGFRPLPALHGVFGDPHARIVVLARRGKKTACGTIHKAFYDRKRRRVRDLSCGGFRIYLDLEVRRVDCRSCGKVKMEKLSFLLDGSLYTKRLAHSVGRRCRSASVQSIAKELRLDRHQVKEMDKQYMQEQLRRAGRAAPEAIGVDEISIRKGHTYRIVVSDLLRKRPIWFGGVDRSRIVWTCSSLNGERRKPARSAWL